MTRFNNDFGSEAFWMVQADISQGEVGRRLIRRNNQKRPINDHERPGRPVVRTQHEQAFIQQRHTDKF